MPFCAGEEGSGIYSQVVLCSTPASLLPCKLPREVGGLFCLIPGLLVPKLAPGTEQMPDERVPSKCMTGQPSATWPGGGWGALWPSLLTLE